MLHMLLISAFVTQSTAGALTPKVKHINKMLQFCYYGQGKLCGFNYWLIT